MYFLEESYKYMYVQKNSNFEIFESALKCEISEYAFNHRKNVNKQRLSLCCDSELS